MGNNLLEKTPVAIIGQAAIFAGASNLTEYWDNILNKIDSISEVPPSRWDPDDYYDPDPTAEDKTYCKVGGFIPDIDFDPLEFGLPPNLMEVTDSSQLLSLVVARDALIDAGYGMEREFDRENTGVVLGVAGGQKLISDLTSRIQYPIWRQVLESSGISGQDTDIIIEKMKLAYAPWNENSFPGLLGNVIAGRIANRFDLGGMNSVVDAACASSLAAVKTAVSELIEGRANMMISGGVDADNSPFTYLCFSKTPAFSPSGKIRPFDQESDGMLIGEGLGMVVLKRLEDAEKDGDRIYAVIKGIGSSSDGRYKSIYAPRPSGQSLAIERAYNEAGFQPNTIGLIEAHGTGTNAGDPAEFSGLRTVFGTANGNKQTIAVGSVKSQIGHTKAAAGAAGLIKAALSLDQKVLPPTINVSNPSPQLEIEGSQFYINTETRPWFRRKSDQARRAAVSAFGFGGTNFHLVLEEYSPPQAGYSRLRSVSRMIFLAAESRDGLIDKIKQYAADFDSNHQEGAFQRLAEESALTSPGTDSPRLGFVADTAQEAASLLTAALAAFENQPESDAWDHPKGIRFRSRGIGPDEKVAALFPGQGSQYLNMGRELAINFPPVMQAIEHMDELFREEGQTPLSSVLYPPPEFTAERQESSEQTLRETDYAQAGIGIFSYGIYRLLQEAGFRPDMTAGHSFGELTALWAGGALTEETFLRLVKARGTAMKPPDEPEFDAGTMAAVKGPLKEIEEAVESMADVQIANQNSPTQVVLAGPVPQIDQAVDQLTERGYKVTKLPVSAAFHTPLVEHASVPFAKAVEKEAIQQPTLPVYSNTTGKAYPMDDKECKKILSGHILQPVIFKDQIEEIYNQGGRVFIEIGPRQVLSNLVRDILDGKECEVLAVNPSRDKSDDRQFREAVVAMKVIGLPLGNIDPYQRQDEQAAKR